MTLKEQNEILRKALAKIAKEPKPFMDCPPWDWEVVADFRRIARRALKKTA